MARRSEHYHLQRQRGDLRFRVVRCWHRLTSAIVSSSSWMNTTTHSCCFAQGHGTIDTTQECVIRTQRGTCLHVRKFQALERKKRQL